MTRSHFEQIDLDELDALLEEEGIEVDGAMRALAPIAPRDPHAKVPATPAQERLWFVEKLIGDSPAYNIPVRVRLRGALDLVRLQGAIAALVDRHESLRTRFREQEGQLLQHIEPANAFTLPVVELCDLEPEERSLRAQELAYQESRTPFAIDQDVMFRARLLRLADDEHHLLLTMHHAVSEAWSFAIFFRELSLLYGGSALGPAPLQYGDVAVFQHSQTADAAAVERCAERLAGPHPVLDLPADRPRRAVRSYNGAWVKRVLDRQATQAIEALAQQAGATTFMTVLAGFSAMLQRMTGECDILVGSPVNRRDRVELEEVLGFFVNTVVVRTNLSGDPTARELLGRVRQASLDALSDQHVPFEKVVERVQPERNLGVSPIFQVAFVHQDAPERGAFWTSLRLPGLETTIDIVPSQTAKYELTLESETRAGRLSLAFEYDTDRFDGTTMERWLEMLESLLRGMAEQPATRLHALPLLPAAERQRLLFDFNRTDVPLPDQANLPALFDTAAAAHAEAIAVSHGGQRVSYAELRARANQLARTLVEAGVERGDRVGLWLERGTELIVAMLGVLKAGGAYLPLDTDYPDARIAFMLKDGAVDHIVVGADGERPPGVSADRCHAVPAEADGSLPAPQLDLGPDDLAYVLYTSGSTGTPKGVLTPHRGVVRLLWQTNYVQLGPRDVFPQIAHPAFDAITFEVWGALCFGGRVCVLDRDEVLSPNRLTERLRAERVTRMFITSSLFNQTIAERPDAFSTLETLLVGGEALDVESIGRCLQGGPPKQLFNGYGPTEATTFSNVGLVSSIPRGASAIPIGGPITNSRSYVLDSYGQPVPIGVVGEHYIGGPGVALGYVGREKLTAERFVPDPFCGRRGASMYRTGDLVRWLPDGNLDFVGRADGQVKLHGFRMEMGEIEACARRFAGIEEACVVVHGEGSTRRLVAYCSPAGIDVSALRAFLAEQLPPQMVPAMVMPLHRLPLTPNGKVDRRALPDPVRQAADDEAKVLPRTETERVICAEFSNILRADQVGIRDEFFSLGGNSMLAVTLVRRLRDRYGRELPLAELFRNGTPARLARVVDGWAELAPLNPLLPPTPMRLGPRGKGPLVTVPAFEPVVPIQTRGRRRPIFCVHGAGGNVLNFRAIAVRLGEEQPFYGLQAPGVDGLRPPLACVEEAARLYVDAIRRVQPEGPYTLMGYSGGGVIAFEMAHELSRRGQRCTQVVMLDAGAGRERPEERVEWWRRQWQGLQEHGVEYLTDKIRERLEWDRWRARKKAAELRRAFGKPIPWAIRNRYMVESFVASRTRYTVRQHPDLAITVFVAASGGLVSKGDVALGWDRYTAGPVRVRLVPGDHGTLMIPPQVDALATVLSEAVRG